MKRLALALLVLAGLAIPPAAAQAVVPGPNGPFAFASGRDDGATAFTDANAQLWMVNTVGGTALRLSSGFNTYMHRHPTWSPDRTKIAYARCATSGCGFAGPWDIYVQDLLNGGTPQNITSSAQSEDRPAWSPDGTRIAYTKNTTGTNWDIVVKSATGAGSETTVATAADQVANGWRQARAQWLPNSQAVVYAKYFSATDYDIRRAQADGSTPIGTPVDVSTNNDYQPAVSADGTRICFTRDTAMANLKDVYIEPIGGGTATPLVTGTGDEFECAWSPDGTKVAFGRGGFGNGQVLVRNASGTGEATVTDVATRFDGNVDWAPNPRPTCANRTVSVAFNGFVSIPLSCTDASDPPSFLQNDPSPEIVASPAHGVLGSIAGNGAVIYTPNKDFSGGDSFTYKGNDGTSDSAAATVAINVAGPPSGGNGGGAAVPPAKASFRGSKRSIRASRRWRFSFSFRATPGLKGRITLKTIRKVRPRDRGRRRRATFANKTFRVPSSGKVKVRFKLSRRNRLILRRYKQLRIGVTVKLRNSANLTSTAKVRITLKAPKRRRR